MAPNVTTPQEAKNKIVRNCVRRNTQVSTVSYFASFVCLFVCRSIYWVAIVWAMLNLYFSHCQASTLVSDMADRFLCFPLPLSALITAGFHCLPALSLGPGLFQFSWQQDASVWGLPWMFVSKHKPAIGKKEIKHKDETDSVCKQRANRLPACRNNWGIGNQFKACDYTFGSNVKMFWRFKLKHNSSKT